MFAEVTFGCSVGLSASLQITLKKGGGDKQTSEKVNKQTDASEESWPIGLPCVESSVLLNICWVESNTVVVRMLPTTTPNRVIPTLPVPTQQSGKSPQIYSAILKNKRNVKSRHNFLDYSNVVFLNKVKLLIPESLKCDYFGNLRPIRRPSR